MPKQPVGPEERREAAERVGKRRRRRGCAVGCVSVLLLLCLIPAATYVGIGIADRRLVNEALDRVREAGDPLTAEESQGTFVHESPEKYEATRRWIAARAFAEEALKQPLTEDVPIVGAYGVEAKLDVRGFYSPETVRLVERFLQGPGEAAIEEMHAARRAGGRARYVGDFAETDDVALEDPWSIARLNRFLLLDMEIHAAQGDADGAAECVLTMLAHSDAFADEPTVEAMDLRTASFRQAKWHASSLIERMHLSEENLSRLQAAFAAPDFQSELLRLLRAEQYRLVRGFETDESTGDERIDQLIGVPLRGADEAETIGLYQDFLDRAKLGLPEAHQAKLLLERRRDRLDSSEWSQLRGAVASYMTYEIDRYVNCYMIDLALSRLAVTGIAVERYRLRHGAWPEGLDALVPEFLSEIPIDPLDGQPLRYAVTPERVELYSLVQFEAYSGGKESFDEGELTFHRANGLQERSRGEASSARSSPPASP